MAYDRTPLKLYLQRSDTILWMRPLRVSDLWEVPVSDEGCQDAVSSLKWAPRKCHRLTPRFKLESGNTWRGTEEFRPNYHLCGNKVNPALISIMFGKSIIQGKACMCAVKVKGCKGGRIFLLLEAKIVGVETLLLYKNSPVDLLCVTMQEKLSCSNRTYRFFSEESNTGAVELPCIS